MSSSFPESAAGPGLSKDLPFRDNLISSLIAGAARPGKAFDPCGAWLHRYSVWLMPAKRDRQPSIAGSLLLRRSIASEGPSLDVEQVCEFRGPGAQEKLTAVVLCRQDALSTPVSWTVDSCILDVAAHQIAHTSASQTGHSDGLVSVTSNWSLLDAVQRLPFAAQAVRFDLIEDMTLPKPNQLLRYAGSPSPGIHRFEQTGWGVLPVEYWLDDSHRLLMAVYGVRAFVLEEESA
jgi:hypothetical protein